MSAADLSEGAAARIAVLRRTAAALERAARLRAANTLDAEQAAQVAGYERWLRMQSARLRDLAMGWEGRLARGASAGEMQEICRYYQQEGAQLQERLSRENRQFPVSSPTLKQKHALAQQAIEALH